MAVKDIDFKQPVKLIINGEEYECSRDIKVSDHVFNNAGSKIIVNEVYPKALELANGDRLTTFKLPKYSFAQLYFGDKLFRMGVIKVQSGGTINPRQPKHLGLTIVTYKEWLTSQFMDFPIINMTPEAVVNLVVKTMSNQRIKVGTLAFGNTDRIPIYNAKTKTAYDILKMIEKHSNSTFQVKSEDDETISINFFNDNSIKNTNNGNKGVDVILDTQQDIDDFYDLYKVEDFSWNRNDTKARNFVRVESEALISNIQQEQTIDTSQGESEIQLQFKVGIIDANKTFVTYPDNTTRKLTIVDRDGAAKGKLYDIIYELNSNTITLNKRLVGKQSIVTVTYNKVERLSLDVQNSSDQREVASVAGGGLGRKDQYEKYNDVTNIDMLLALAKRHVETGTDDKTKIMIDSGLPIWNLGEHTEIKIFNEPSLNGEYIVREFNITIWGADSINGSERVKIEYSLVKSKDLENELNFDDPITYRDNPLFDLAGATVDTTTSIDENIFMVATNLIDECNLISAEELDHDLDFDLDWKPIKDGNTVWVI